MPERNSSQIGIINKVVVNGILTYIVILDEEAPLLFAGVENRTLVVQKTEGDKSTGPYHVSTIYKFADKSVPATPVSVGVSYYAPSFGTISVLAPATDSDSETTTETSD